MRFNVALKEYLSCSDHGAIEFTRWVFFHSEISSWKCIGAKWIHKRSENMKSHHWHLSITIIKCCRRGLSLFCTRQAFFSLVGGKNDFKKNSTEPFSALLNSPFQQKGDKSVPEHQSISDFLFLCKLDMAKALYINTTGFRKNILF